MSKLKQQYLYNPHRHVKIWFSNNRSVFMNDENQMRLIEMRYQNPKDSINLVYDSSLLDRKALNDLSQFCREYSISTIDSAQLHRELKSDRERTLYEYYKDEMNYLNEGGNLAVASDIIRWLSPVYLRGSYTDFDVPVDTSKLSECFLVNSPLVMNIGSLKIRDKEVILSNNDYIAVVDPTAALEYIEQIQDEFIKVLSAYANDFIEKTEHELVGDSLINRCLFGFLRNRSESIYIAKSKSVFPTLPISSRRLRGYINKIMSDEHHFIDFHRVSPLEKDEAVIKRLKTHLSTQLGFIKRLFFGQEYKEIKKILALPDPELISLLMKKERSLYLRSIVVCTTGPIAIANALFHGYVFNSKYIHEQIEPFSFNSYGLQHAFISKNSLSLHDNVLTMLYFLGAAEGELNDSSWLEEGANLQAQRGQDLEQRKHALNDSLSYTLIALKTKMMCHATELRDNANGFWALFMRNRRMAKLEALLAVLSCFKDVPQKEFDLTKFRTVFDEVYQKERHVFSRLFYNRTKELIHEVERYTHEATILGLTKNHRIKLDDQVDGLVIIADQKELPVI